MGCDGHNGHGGNIMNHVSLNRMRLQYGWFPVEKGEVDTLEGVVSRLCRRGNPRARGGDGNLLVFPSGKSYVMSRYEHRGLILQAADLAGITIVDDTIKSLLKRFQLVRINTLNRYVRIEYWHSLTSNQLTHLRLVVIYTGADEGNVEVEGVMSQSTLRQLVKSKDAEKHWSKIKHGRGWYHPRYIGYKWTELPKKERQNISRMFNSQQGRKNKFPPDDPDSTKVWRGFVQRRSVGKRRGNPMGHYTSDGVERIRAYRTLWRRELDAEKVGGLENVEKSSRQDAVFSIIAGVGGFIAGQLLRKKLFEMGMDNEQAKDAERRALDTAYEMAHRKFRIVKKASDGLYLVGCK